MDGLGQIKITIDLAHIVENDEKKFGLHTALRLKVVG